MTQHFSTLTRPWMTSPIFGLEMTNEVDENVPHGTGIKLLNKPDPTKKAVMSVFTVLYRR